MVRGLISERSYPWAVEPAGLNGSVVVVDAGGRMQRKAAGGETQGGAANGLGRIRQQAPHALSGAFAGGQLPLHRSS